MSDEPLDSGTTTRIMVDAILGSGFIFSEILPFVKTTKYNGILQFAWKFVKDRFISGANPTVGTVMNTVEESFTAFSAAVESGLPGAVDPVVGIPENTTGETVGIAIPPGQIVPTPGNLTDWQSSWQGPVLGIPSGLGGWHGGNYTIMQGNSILGGYSCTGNVYGTLGNYPGTGIDVGINTDYTIISLGNRCESGSGSGSSDTIIDKINVGTDTSLDLDEGDHVTVVIVTDEVDQ
jgi:hypothetical protein